MKRDLIWVALVAWLGTNAPAVAESLVGSWHCEYVQNETTMTAAVNYQPDGRLEMLANLSGEIAAGHIIEAQFTMLGQWKFDGQTQIGTTDSVTFNRLSINGQTTRNTKLVRALEATMAKNKTGMEAVNFLSDDLMQLVDFRAGNITTCVRESLSIGS